MKKLISFCLAALMMIAVLPIVALAAGNDQVERDQLLTLACSIFPEYADIIQGETVATYSLPSSDNPSEVVFTETRNISNKESLSITQLASGDVIVLDASYDYTELENTGSSISNVGTDKIGSASFKATCTNISGIFKYQNVGFIITQGGSGSFTSYGSASTSGDIAIGNYSRSSTNINYPLTFNRSATSQYRIYLNFSLYFRDGKLIVAFG